MFSLLRPTTGKIDKFLADQNNRELSYLAIGASYRLPPAGYAINHRRTKLGEGEAVFHAAKEAFRRWRQFEIGWIAIRSSTAEPVVGAAVAIQIRVCGAWSLSACRVVYSIDEQRFDKDGAAVWRFGFANGTLPDHVGTGEERFLVEWNLSTGEVWYDILAFSRPNHLLTRMAAPIFRRFQKKFARDSSAAMLRAVQSTAGKPTEAVTTR